MGRGAAAEPPTARETHDHASFVLPRPGGLDRALPAAIAALTLSIALLDVATSAELVASILFTAPISLCFVHGSKRLLWGTTAAAACFTIFAQVWGIDRETPASAPDAWTNRVLLIGSLLTLAAFIDRLLEKSAVSARAFAEVEHQRATLEGQNTRLEGMEARYRGLLEAAPDAMVIVDRRGRIVLVNAQTEQLFGYSREELLDKPVEILVPRRFQEKHPANREAYIERPVPRSMGSGIELFGLRKDGTEIPVEISLSPLTTNEGTLVSSAIRDITERRMTEAALKLANRELEAFSYSVAHDLRAPLRGMNGFAHILLDTYKNKLDAEGQDWLQEIVLNATKMGSLIDALLALSRVSRAELKPETVDLSAVARASAAQLAASDPSRHVEFSIEDDLQTELDPQLARALVDNLLGNAWKFTSKKEIARIEVGSEEHDGSRCFFVRDNGAGFDMEFANKLFTPFQRLHAAAEFPGTGVGLATVQRIVHRHGGRIWAEGAVDEGACFSFAVPPAARKGTTWAS